MKFPRKTKGHTGPQPRCTCGECQPCRARRRRYGEKLDSRRFRPALLKAPGGFSKCGYVAGLIDGEGCITMCNQCWRVQIAMTHEPVIRWLGLLGGTVREQKVKGNRQRMWRWLVMRQRDVLVLLESVRPYLIVKHERSNEAIADIKRRLLAHERRA